MSATIDGQELYSDFSEISLTEQQHKAFPYFMTAMRGKAYGGEALWDAWLWLKEGWQRLEGKLTAQATNDWCDAW